MPPKIYHSIVGSGRNLIILPWVFMSFYKNCILISSALGCDPYTGIMYTMLRRVGIGHTLNAMQSFR